MTAKKVLSRKISFAKGFLFILLLTCSSRILADTVYLCEGDGDVCEQRLKQEYRGGNDTSIVEKDVKITGQTESAIYNEGRLLLSGNVDLSGNSNNEAGGGAIYNNGYQGTNGNAIHLGGTGAQDDLNFFLKNNSSATNGGAVTNLHSANFFSNGSLWVEQNQSDGSGGAFYNFDSQASIVGDALFQDNHAAKNGGAFANVNGNEDTGGGSVSFSSKDGLCTTGCDWIQFQDNTAGNNGGALYNDTAVMVATNMRFHHNISGNMGGAIYNHSEDSGRTTIESYISEQAIFTSNESAIGGAIYNGRNASIFYTPWTGGTELFQFDGNKAVGNENITPNSESAAYNGAGGAILNRGSIGFGATEVRFSNNTAATNGGAIYNMSSDNDSQSWLYGDIKGINIDASSITFSENEAKGDGGALYNTKEGEITFIGNVKFDGNKAGGKGKAVYNEGTFTFSDNQDELAKYSAQDGVLTKAVRIMQGSNQTFYNSGILNFVNSQVALYRGINTDTGFENDASRLIGTVHFKKSTVDLGGFDYAGIIHANEFTIDADSTLRSHVGYLKTVGHEDTPYGFVKANKVLIADGQTGGTLSLLLPYGYDLDEKGETRDYKIFDVNDPKNNIKGKFGTLTNALSYEVRDLGNGAYRITNKANCGVGGSYDEDIDGCVCNKDQGYVARNNTCEMCPEGSISTGTACVCQGNTVMSGNSCQLCPANTEPNDNHTACECSEGFVGDGTNCYPKNDCNGHGKQNESNGACACFDGWTGDSCSSCDTGYLPIGDMCVKAETCDSNEELDGKTNTCHCKGGYVSVNGVCEPSNKDKCVENEQYDSAGNTCVCSGKFEKVGNQCLPACTGGKIRSGYLCVCKTGEKEVNGVCKKIHEFCENCDANEKETAKGWLTGDVMEGNDLAKKIQDDLFGEYLVNGSSEDFRKALDALAPDVSPLVQQHVTENARMLSAIVDERLHLSSEKTFDNGRIYRKPKKLSNLWVQTSYGKSKYNVRKGWDMNTYSYALGMDVPFNDDAKMGLAYTHIRSDGDSVGRDTEIKSHGVMVYGSYQPSRVYTDWLAVYTHSKVDEEKHVLNNTVLADYSFDALITQAMIGYKLGTFEIGQWTTGIIKPQMGMRYIYTNQHSYTDNAGQAVSSADGHTVTGLLGAEYGIGFHLTDKIVWFPEFRLNLTYDVMEPKTKMNVGLVNGNTYTVKTENMERFGIEVGTRIGLDISEKVEIAIEYDGVFKGNYKNHAGIASLKYKF